MHHTLSLIEYKEFLSVNCLSSKSYEEDFSYIGEYVEDMRSWTRKVSGLNPILCIILEQFQKKEFNGVEMLNFIYLLPEEMNFEIQESTIRFVDSLFDNNINHNLTLEEHLIIAQNRLYGR